MTSISDNAADDDATPTDDGNELQMSKEMEPSLERTKGATLGMDYGQAFYSTRVRFFNLSQLVVVNEPQT